MRNQTLSNRPAPATPAAPKAKPFYFHRKRVVGADGQHTVVTTPFHGRREAALAYFDAEGGAVFVRYGSQRPIAIR